MCQTAVFLQDQATTEAIGSGALAQSVVPDHFRVEIAFRNHTYATNGSHYPGCVQLDSTRVAFESNDYMDVLKFFYWVL